MTGRTCKSCGEKAVHRAHRAQWMRLLSYLVPIRPMQCHACRARSWALMTRDRDAWQSWLVSAVLWISLLSLLLGIGSPPEAEKAAAPVDEAQSVPVPVTGAGNAPAGPARDAVKLNPAPPQTAPAADSATQIAQAVGAVESAAPSPAAKTPPPPAPKPVAVNPAKQKHTLQAVESSVDGKALRVLLRASHAPFTFNQFESKAASGHVLDLPGNWQFVDGLKMLYAFPESNLQQIRFGLHGKFLRVVLTLRRPNDAAQPRVASTPDGLLIEIDG